MADRFMESIIDSVQLLAKMPKAGLARPDIHPDTRSVPVGRYMIYHRKRESGGIEISRVLHAMRDQKKAWGEDERG
jgi:toxin ParE1/3/4